VVDFCWGAAAPARPCARGTSASCTSQAYPNLPRCGDFLLVKNRGEEDRVTLSNVMNVSASTNMNPPQITLRLVKPGKFGTEIAFSPTAGFALNPFAKNQVAEDLIVRVDRARSKRAV